MNKMPELVNLDDVLHLHPHLRVHIQICMAERWVKEIVEAAVEAQRKSDIKWIGEDARAIEAQRFTQGLERADNQRELNEE